MDFFKNFVGQVVNSMPFVAKVAYVSSHIKRYSILLSEDKKFCTKFVAILKMFIRQEISLDDMCTIMDAADGLKLTRAQISYFCKRVHENGHVVEIMEKYVDYTMINDEDINYLSEFLVHEINNAIMYG